MSPSDEAEYPIPGPTGDGPGDATYDDADPDDPYNK